MVEIVHDKTKGQFMVTMTYGGVTKAIVSFAPSANWFDVVRVRNEHGDEVRDDMRFHYIAQATDELQAWLRERLQPQSSHVTVSGLEERVTIALYVRVANLSSAERCALKVLDPHTLQLLLSLSRTMVSESIRLKASASQSGHDPPSWYDIKGDTLRNHHLATSWLPEQRDLYSSILSTALSWRRNRVPRATYDTYCSFKPGLDLVYKQT